jgi:hypothetical protein
LGSWIIGGPSSPLVTLAPPSRPSGNSPQKIRWVIRQGLMEDSPVGGEHVASFIGPPAVNYSANRTASDEEIALQPKGIQAGAQSSLDNIPQPSLLGAAAKVALQALARTTPNFPKIISRSRSRMTPRAVTGPAQRASLGSCKALAGYPLATGDLPLPFLPLVERWGLFCA